MGGKCPSLQEVIHERMRMKVDWNGRFGVDDIALQVERDIT